MWSIPHFACKQNRGLSHNKKNNKAAGERVELQEGVCGAPHLPEHVLSTVGISVEEGGCVQPLIVAGSGRAYGAAGISVVVGES